MELTNREKFVILALIDFVWAQGGVRSEEQGNELRALKARLAVVEKRAEEEKKG